MESATQERDEFGIAPVTALLVEDISLARKVEGSQELMPITRTAQVELK